MNIPLDSIVTLPQVQPRRSLSMETIDDYAAAHQAKAKFPPIVVFKWQDNLYLLAHGFHRYRSALQAGLKTINAMVKNGDVHDALLFAVGAHRDQEKIGLRFTNADKRRAVELMLADEKWSKWSDRRIAQAVGVSNTLVSGLRPSLSTVDNATRETKDGRQYPAKRKPKEVKDEAKDQRGPEGGEDPPAKEEGIGQGEEDQQADVGSVDSGSDNPPRPGRRDGGSGSQRGGEARDAEARAGSSNARGPSKVDWKEQFNTLKRRIGEISKEFNVCEGKMDSLLAEVRDFREFSLHEKEGIELGVQVLVFVRTADRIRQKFME